MPSDFCINKDIKLNSQIVFQTMFAVWNDIFIKIYGNHL